MSQTYTVIRDFDWNGSRILGHTFRGRNAVESYAWSVWENQACNCHIHLLSGNGAEFLFEIREGSSGAVRRWRGSWSRNDAPAHPSSRHLMGPNA